ncbi:type VI secretion system-associated FHA domain protein TagH [Methylosinus sp. H3A]|uniref:type VI secretion system-associated FHA domain protein TagH n=1 Tax=Methylosinus sp. H3A TaxID=2785786 RepID=UPI0018C2F0EA|nr:type VI secretion system-associated FHA domain protein TagH [Methylosinus sp. H3A]MBG0809506.1 type VI secretion system-associated FHA domain protein TagH [Methylosinus sp. H3A]
MRLTLTIENFSRRPDGGPLTYVAEGRRSIDIGRNQHLDWCLPDENHFISGRHCEIAPRDGCYYLTDVSTNGTFVNHPDNHVQSPYRLRDGDRLFIGEYVVVVHVEGDAPGVEVAPVSATQSTPSYDDFWSSSEPAPPPIDPRLLDPRRLDPTPHVDWIDHVADAPTPMTPTPRRPSAEPASIWGLSPPPAQAASAPVVAPDDIWGAPPPPLSVAREASAAPGVDWAPPPSSPIPPPSLVAAAPPPRAPVAPPAAAPAPSTTSDEAYAEFLASFARALGASEQIFAGATPAQLGEQLGGLTRLVAEETRQLLRARAEAKRLTRSASHTIIEAQGNNPLKFAPTTEEALRIVFGPPRPGYLSAGPAFAQAFVDVKAHELRTYAAMQEAVRMLSDGLDPAGIEKGQGKDSGIASLVGSRKARLWDRYVERWAAMSPRSGDKLADAFMRNFADCYDRADARK